jgi:putative membrane protein
VTDLLYGWTLAPLPVLAVAIAGGLYAAGVMRVARRDVRWPRGRTVLFALGLLAIAVALVSPLASEDERFPIHVVQHLLLGMIAPLLLALSAPITLLLRAVPPRRRRAVVRVLHSPLRVLGDPITAGALNVAGLYVLYLTPLYAATLTHPQLHDAIHLHFLLVGCVFAWSMIGLDPIPRRPFPYRVAVLVVVLALHGTLAKLLYAHGPAIGVDERLADWRLGAQIMWYGGDLIDGLFLILFFGQWYRLEGRKLARHRGVPMRTMQALPPR